MNQTNGSTTLVKDCEGKIINIGDKVQSTIVDTMFKGEVVSFQFGNPVVVFRKGMEICTPSILRKVEVNNEQP
jgi:hypothetical protein